MAPCSSVEDEVTARTCIDCGGTGTDAAAVALERLGAVLPLSCGRCNGTGIDTSVDDWNVTRWTPDRGYGVDAYEGHRLARQVVEEAVQ